MGNITSLHRGGGAYGSQPGAAFPPPSVEKGTVACFAFTRVVFFRFFLTFFQSQRHKNRKERETRATGER